MDTPALALARQRSADNLPERVSWDAVTLSVTNLDRAEAFWTEALGFVRRAHEGPGVALGASDQTLVVLVSGATSPVARGHAGMYHVAFGMADMGAGAPCTHRLAMNIWAGLDARPAPRSSARLLSYRLETADAQTMAAARARLSEDPASGDLHGTDPAGVTLTLRFAPGISNTKGHAA